MFARSAAETSVELSALEISTGDEVDWTKDTVSSVTANTARPSRRIAAVNVARVGIDMAFGGMVGVSVVGDDMAGSMVGDDIGGVPVGDDMAGSVVGDDMSGVSVVGDGMSGAPVVGDVGDDMADVPVSGDDMSGRRGPKPSIPCDIERDLVEWIAAMQRAGLPGTRREIIRRANRIRQKLEEGRTRSSEASKPLTSGWYKRFRGRYPELVDRRAQPIARVRNSVEEAVVDTLFGTLTKLIVEHKIGPSRMFNMDETSFSPDNSSKSVVAVRGSPNVWTKEMKENFHMTVVAAISASGVFRDTEAVNRQTRSDVDKMRLELSGVRDEVSEKTIISCPTSAINGFAVTGLYLPNLVQMKRRLQLSTSGGVRGNVGTASWLKRKQTEVRSDVLTHPPDHKVGGKRAKKTRATEDIAGRLVTRAMVAQIEL
ncbi:hypothetical protein P43SY_003706 [Pythium insidiosum]|uniref:HTH CENPB-type domain-containing protein n=1 Tax=Pythium insidiosum TaxID=114742 RepID=A0AAD5LBI4_PYTIN|nr:hypothetical protein P43SY_003706 [Pythium insidiosum]